MRIDIDTSCRAGQTATIGYGRETFTRPLDQSGRVSFILDLFQGKDAAVSVGFKDGLRQPVAIEARDLERISKFAVIWRAPVNLDLHAFEYTAREGQAGHVWAGAPRSAEAAEAESKKDGRGHGFLSTLSDATTPGERIEVYTFLHAAGQETGAVTLALDYESRGDQPRGPHCGSGALASVDVKVWRMVRGSGAVAEDRVVAPASCDAALAREVRFNPDSMPHLVLR